ncbi:MAG TPA: DUF433 domain-containing protein [Polyangiaceae bacterium]|nr:DUF433 domain-containing protein [Polyangiaceae bacterium]
MAPAELLEQQAMALPPEERKRLAVKLLASVAVAQPPRERRPGTAAGRVHMAPDFDAPLELVECRDGTRSATYQDHFARDPHVCGGLPVIRGTRIPVHMLLAHLAHGSTVDAIVKEFPSVTEADVGAVIAFAAASTAEDLPAPSPVPNDVRIA